MKNFQCNILIISYNLCQNGYFLNFIMYLTRMFAYSHFVCNNSSRKAAIHSEFSTTPVDPTPISKNGPIF